MYNIYIFEKPLLRNRRSISFENFINNAEKVDKYTDCCEIIIALLVFEIQYFESMFRFFCNTLYSCKRNTFLCIDQ